MFDYAKWGSTLKTDSKEGQKNIKVDVFAQGRSTIVLQKEVEKATSFYEASGLAHGEASKRAMDYCKEYEALYAEAIKKGYTVTTEEINTYVEDMRTSMTATNAEPEIKKELQAMPQAFGSEEKHWDYQKEIAQKQLPIQKMVNDLEKEYSQDKNASENGWEDYFESYKKKLVSQEQYQEV